MNILARITDWWLRQARQSSHSLRPEPPPPTPVQREPAAPDLLVGPPMVGDGTLRDWMIHHHRRNANVWQAVVVEFYDRVRQDRVIFETYFRGVDLARLQNHFLRGLVFLTHSGLTARKADELAERHAHLRITDEHFDRVAQVLVNVLTDYGVPRVAIPQLRKIAGELKKRIVTA